ncbi:uncharacterized protein LOC111519720 isoform X1 [Drosophila willistoni]|uniref:uncharacterized protein LOC111519720 isoform X1 n=1 Tax=Drosophila willistoni TaxID=7260 RepID=UPI000C26CCB0|nr:uncharacterized protein LOC111519720 isoform X1 [Drosophila willistoni]
MFPRRPTKHPVLPAKQPVAPTIEDIKKYIKSLHPYKFFHKDYVAAMDARQVATLSKRQIGRLSRLAWYNLPPHKRMHYILMVRRKIADVQNLMLLKPKKGNQKKGNQKKGLARSLMSDKSRKNFDIMMLNRFGHMKK